MESSTCNKGEARTRAHGKADGSAASRFKSCDSHEGGTIPQGSLAWRLVQHEIRLRAATPTWCPFHLGHVAHSVEQPDPVREEAGSTPAVSTDM